jgi:hypothetical protein
MLHELGRLGDFFKEAKSTKEDPKNIVLKLTKEVAEVIKPTGEYDDRGRKIFETNKGRATADGDLIEGTTAPTKAIPIGKNVDKFNRSYKAGSVKQVTQVEEILSGRSNSVIIPSEIARDLKVGQIIELEPSYKGYPFQPGQELSAKAEYFIGKVPRPTRTLPTVKAKVVQIDSNINDRVAQKNPDKDSNWKMVEGDKDFADSLAKDMNFKDGFMLSQLFKQGEVYGFGPQTRLKLKVIKSDSINEQIIPSGVKEIVDWKNKLEQYIISKQDKDDIKEKKPIHESNLTDSEKQVVNMYDDIKDQIDQSRGKDLEKVVKDIINKYSNDYPPDIVDDFISQAISHQKISPAEMSIDEFILRNPFRYDTKLGLEGSLHEGESYKPYLDKRAKEALAETHRAWGHNPPENKFQAWSRLQNAINDGFYSYLNDTYTKVRPDEKGGYSEVTASVENLPAQIEIWRQAKIKAYDEGLSLDTKRALDDMLHDHVLWDRYIEKSKWGQDIDASFKARDELAKRELDNFSRAIRISPENEYSLGRDVSVEDVEGKIEFQEGDIREQKSSDGSLDTAQELAMDAIERKESMDNIEGPGGYVTVDLLMRMMGLGHVSDKISGKRRDKAIEDYHAMKLNYFSVSNEARKTGQNPRDYLVNIFHKANPDLYPLEDTVPLDKTGEFITAERMADAFIGDYTADINALQERYNLMKKADEADKSPNPYTKTQRIGDTWRGFVDKRKDNFKDSQQIVRDFVKAIQYYPDLPGSARLMIDNFSASHLPTLEQYRASNKKVIFKKLDRRDSQMATDLIALHDDLRLSGRTMKLPDGKIVNMDIAIGAVDRKSNKILKELKAKIEEINKIGGERAKQIFDAKVQWDSMMADQLNSFVSQGELDAYEGRKDYAPYIVERHLPEWGYHMMSGMPSHGKNPYQGYLKRAMGTIKKRTLTPDILLDYITNVKHDKMVKEFMNNLLAQNSAYDKVPEAILKANGIEEGNPWGRHSHELDNIDGTPYIHEGQKLKWFSPDRFRFTTEYDPETGESILTGYKQTFLIPEPLFNAFDTWSSHQNRFVRSINDVTRFWKAAAIMTSWPTYNWNNLIGDTYLMAMMHPNRTGLLKELGTGTNMAYKILLDRAGINVHFTPYEMKLKQFLEKYLITDSGQMFSEISHRSHLDRAKLEGELSAFAKSKEAAKFVFNQGDGWHKIPDAMKEVSNMRESVLRIANASYILKEIQAGRQRRLLNGFGFLGKEFKDGADILEKGAIIAKEFSVNYNRQSPTYRKVISGGLSPFGKWYFDMDRMTGRWMWKGKDFEDSFIKAVTGKRPSEIFFGKGEYKKPDLGEAFRIARQKNIGFYDEKVYLGMLPKAAAFSVGTFLASWYLNYRDEDIAAVERQLPEGLRNRLHAIMWVDKDKNGKLGKYFVYAPQTPADVLPGWKFFGVLASMLHRKRTGELSSYDEVARRTLKEWYKSEKAGTYNLVTPVIKFAKGWIDGKDPTDGTPIYPRYRPDKELTSMAKAYYLSVFFAKTALPMFGSMYGKYEYRKEDPSTIMSEFMEKWGIPKDISDPTSGLRAIVGIKQYRPVRGIELPTPSGGKQFVSVGSLKEEATEKINKPTNSVFLKLEDDWIRSGLTPSEFKKSKEFKNAAMKLKEIYGDAWESASPSLSKRINNIFDPKQSPFKAEAWLKNKIEKAKGEEKERLEALLEKVKGYETNQQLKSEPKATRKTLPGIIKKRLGYEE